MRSSFTKAFAVISIFFTVCRSFAGELEARCAEAEKKGIDFLAANQQEAGQFPTQTWFWPAPEKKQSFDTPFTAAQVLFSLTFCESATARGVRERAAQYILSQKEGPGVWCYFGKGGKRSTDVDDTSLAWAALKRSGQSIPPEALAAVRKSKNEAGLFNTWIGEPSTWIRLTKDDLEIDSIVNLNALLLFGLASSENVDVVCNYVLAEVESDRFKRVFVYYTSPLAFTWAFSRAYTDGSVKCLEKGVAKIRMTTLALQQENGGWGDDFETAAGLLTLINLGEKGEPVERGLKNLLARQTPDGGWALNTAYRGAANRMRFGSRALTTTLSVEALAKFLRR